MADEISFKKYLMSWTDLIFCVAGLLSTSKEELRVMPRKFCEPPGTSNQPLNRANTSEIVQKIREEMSNIRSVQRSPIDAYIITRYDEHQNEYVADRDKLLEYATGFTGTYGLAVVTKTTQVFWTDRLHSILADNELACDWILFISDPSEYLNPSKWLTENLKPGSKVGADPKLMPNSEWEVIARTVSNKSITLLPIVTNLVDAVWTDRPSYPPSMAEIWPEAYAGQSWMGKLTSLRASLKELACDAIVITSMAEIAWLLNIRGSDVPYSPLLRAYAIISKDQLYLYTMLDKLSDSVTRQLLANASCASPNCARVRDYDMVWNDIRMLSHYWKKVLLPSGVSNSNPGVSRAIYLALSLDKRKSLVSPIINAMAVHNTVQRKGMIRAHVRDATLFCNFIANLEIELNKTTDELDEITIGNDLDKMRASDADKLSLGPNYPTSVAFGSNSGIPSYVPSNATNLILNRNQPLIIDAGQHYADGTTALARTFYMFGNGSEENLSDLMEIYTRVVMGLVNLASLRFPASSNANQLDILVRSPLWEVGLDYVHGTARGIGAFLVADQHPISLNYKSHQETYLEPGYFILAECGYYIEEQYGVKLSMVLEVVESNTSNSMPGFLSFAPITMVPFEKKLINATLLSVQQKLWLNQYNEEIRRVIGAETREKSLNDGYNWMIDRTDSMDDLMKNFGPANGRDLKIVFAAILLIKIFP